ncbi:MAG: sulfite exporter TauE/SafE family protein [Solirubrobacteraceae bacterium]
MTGLELVAGVFVLVGALLQSTVGFGFGLVSAPLLFAAFGPAPAVGLLNVLALVLNVVMLAGEGRRPQPLRRLAFSLVAWSIPGLVLGVYVLRNADDRVLQIALTVVVFASLLVRRRRGAPARPAPVWGAPVAGLTSGVLGTTTSTGGPPLVLMLLGRGHDPAQVRDTLVTIFIATSVLAIAVLAVTQTEEAVPPAAAVLALAPVAVAGQLAGRPLFARLSVSGGYERMLTVVLVVSCAVGLAAAVA